MTQKTVNLHKIFLTPPSSLKERLILFAMLVVTFMVFFGPLKFSNVEPVEAVLTAMIPALTVSWGWVVLLRFLFNRAFYTKEK